MIQSLSTLEVLTNIATIGATIVAIFTIVEMGKDRKAARQPEIIIRNNEQIVLCDYPYLHRKWVNSTTYYENNESVKNQCELSIENIGLGVAKEIEVKWEYIYNDFTKIIIEKNADFSIEEEFLVYKPEDREIADVISFAKGRKEENINKIEVLSANHENIYKEKIVIPSTYTDLLSCLLIDGNLDFHQLEIEYPKLICKISYQDVAGVEYNKEYCVSFEFFNAVPNTAKIVDTNNDEIDFEDGYDGIKNIPGAIVKVRPASK